MMVPDQPDKSKIMQSDYSQPESLLSKNSIEIDLVENDEDWPQTLMGKPIQALVETLIPLVLSECNISLIGDAELCIVLSDDEEQRHLNDKWRSKDKATNVLSFPLLDPFCPPRGMLGDIILARQTIALEARQQDKEFDQHVVHLIAHGFLHILGYDHETNSDADIMEAHEIRILARFGISNPYSV